MNELLNFANKKFGIMRTIKEKDKILFCANDVTNALGYVRGRDAVTQHCKGAVKHKYKTSGGMQLMYFITESDLYILIQKCNLLTIDEKIKITKFFQDKNIIKKINFYDRQEISFFYKIKQILKSFDIDIIQQYTVGNYKLDAYIPKFNICIEYDENNHLGYSQKEEKKREKYIKNKINCSFIRLTNEQDDYKNIGIVLKTLVKEWESTVNN